MRADVYLWRPVLAGLFSWTDYDKVTFTDLVHAHEMLDFKEENKISFIDMIGESLATYLK